VATDVQKLIFLDEEKVSDSDKLFKLMNKGKWAQFDKTLKTITDPDTRLFLQAVRLLQEQQYSASLQLLERLPETSFDCQVMMLKTDCLYELKTKSVDFRSRYQHVFDCTKSDTVKPIVKTRYRLVNYGY
jgi:predicted negative regulator of RcsB-dependent stress response